MKNSSVIQTAVSIALSLTLQASVFADSSIAARYRSERAICLSGQSNQDRATCLKEAGAARIDAKKNRLDTDPAQLQKNAGARCDALPADDRAECEKRMSGEGSVSGSVKDGGLLRELTIVTPAK